MKLMKYTFIVPKGEICVGLKTIGSINNNIHMNSYTNLEKAIIRYLTLIMKYAAWFSASDYTVIWLGIHLTVNLWKAWKTLYYILFY